MKLNMFPEAVYYYYKNWEEFNMEKHKHIAIEIMYVIRGKCTVEVDDEIIELKERQYIFMNPNVLHRLIVNKKNACQMLNIEFEWKDDKNHITNVQTLMKRDERLMEMFFSDETYFVLRDADQVYFTLKSLVLELGAKTNKNDLMIDILFVQLFISIAENKREQMEHSSELNKYSIDKVVSYIHENYDYDIGVEELAQLVHLHPNYLHRVFKQEMDMTINKYITKVRIEKAKELLENSDISVTNIANYVGINSSQYFSSIFKKHTGLSPVAYRKYFHDIISS
ncbi:AraC family transcriptional regulator [Aquibacillus salsiterrae]|uniref:AraC family transcriptional regulator n=1 Tax=Aquibacillus salsiterrae TaxID=2950439 RepID=A0A9X3WEX6_9BACI|nr:AraC family transcriptional regulator [Aquibacillus salsiterrae]MDC3418542.1 AraC family transcriptional regulator [Aquibacillus salsiterrae]